LANVELSGAMVMEYNLVFNSIRPSITDDNHNWGKYEIRGNITKAGVPGRYEVHLRKMKPIAVSELVDVTWSDENGVYVFSNLRYLLKGYFTVAIDHEATNTKAMKIASNITPSLPA
jgi:hypothetical protein